MLRLIEENSSLELPAVGPPQPDPVRLGEVVADEDVEPAVAIQVDQQDGQRLRARCKPGRQQLFGASFVVVDAGAVEPVRTHGRNELGVVRTGYQVQVSIAVEIGPCHGVGVVRGKQRRRPRERFAVHAASGVAPPHREPALAGEDDVQPAVRVEIDEIDRPGRPRGKRLAPEPKAAQVPQQ